MYTAVRLQFASSSVASSHAGNYCGELVQKRLVAWENQKPEIKVHTCGTRRHSSYILWPRLVANLQQKHQLKNRMKGFHAAALACLALAHAIAPPGGEALVDGEIARGRERDHTNTTMGKSTGTTSTRGRGAIDSSRRASESGICGRRCRPRRSWRTSPRRSRPPARSSACSVGGAAKPTQRTTSIPSRCIPLPPPPSLKLTH